MIESTIRIIPFEPVYQIEIDAMLAAIATEYSESFFHQPLKKLNELYMLPNHFYWVALVNEKVAGIIGVIINKEYAVLKSLFVAKAARGAELQIAHQLLNIATNKVKQAGKQHLFLGTMEQFHAAQRFYEKHGYRRIDKELLPVGYPINALDTVFYYREIV